jgi:hypothetical protein
MNNTPTKKPTDEEYFKHDAVTRLDAIRAHHETRAVVAQPEASAKP